MKIIAHGKYHEREYRRECENCGCIFEVEFQELEKGRPNSVNGMFYVQGCRQYYCECPECGNEIIVLTTKNGG